MNDIERLNEEVKVTLGVSKIGGIGVFAIRDIKKGWRCYCEPDDLNKRKMFSVPYKDFDRFLPEVREVIESRWFAVVNDIPFPHPNDIWPIMFMNHSDDPNYDCLTDCASKDIKKGEELTENYRLMNNYEKIHKFL